MIESKHYSNQNTQIKQLVGNTLIEKKEFKKLICPVCGFADLYELAYDDDGQGSFDICPCCGFQFGVDDDVELENGDLMKKSQTHRMYRDNWLKSEAPVFSDDRYPKEWKHNGKVKKEHLEKQLKNITLVNITWE